MLNVVNILVSRYRNFAEEKQKEKDWASYPVAQSFFIVVIKNMFQNVTICQYVSPKPSTSPSTICTAAVCPAKLCLTISPPVTLYF